MISQYTQWRVANANEIGKHFANLLLRRMGHKIGELEAYQFKHLQAWKTNCSICKRRIHLLRTSDGDHIYSHKATDKEIHTLRIPTYKVVLGRIHISEPTKNLQIYYNLLEPIPTIRDLKNHKVISEYDCPEWPGDERIVSIELPKNNYEKCEVENLSAPFFCKRLQHLV